ncbi:MAG: hypothetical protein K8R55_04610, partial [Desulfuromonadaceae bacterium]|nr:hypothetical protein [Desulfuromonadaceae bacterium]
MKRFRKAICCLVAILLLPMTGMAGSWPNIERSLQGWQGEKQVLLRSSLADPLLSPVVQDLLEDLLSEGYIVLPAGAQAIATSGLMLDLRVTDDSEILALRRAEDGAIIAFERRGVQALSAVAARRGPVSQGAASVKVQPVAVAPPTTLPALPVVAVPSAAATVVQAETRSGPLYGPLAVFGQPRSLAHLTGS